MITAQEVVDNYDNFNKYYESMPIDESGTAVAAVCADLGIDELTSLAIANELHAPLHLATSFFHGFTYCMWLLREKKGH